MSLGHSALSENPLGATSGALTASGTVNAKLTNFKNNCKLIDDEADKPAKP